MVAKIASIAAMVKAVVEAKFPTLLVILAEAALLVDLLTGMEIAAIAAWIQKCQWW